MVLRAFLVAIAAAMGTAMLSPALALSPALNSSPAEKLLVKLRSIALHRDLRDRTFVEKALGAALTELDFYSEDWSRTDSGLWRYGGGTPKLVGKRYVPYPPGRSDTAGLGNPELFFRDRLQAFHRLYFSYRYVHPGQSLPPPQDPKFVAVVSFEDVEEYACITWEMIDWAFGSHPDLIRVQSPYASKETRRPFAYSYAPKGDGMPTEIQIDGPDRGQRGCVHNIWILQYN